MLMEAFGGIVDILDEDRHRWLKLLWNAKPKGRYRGQQLRFQTRLFPSLAQHRLDRVFVGLDVTSGWQPHAQLPVPVQEDGVATRDVAGGSEMANQAASLELQRGDGWLGA